MSYKTPVIVFDDYVNHFNDIVNIFNIAHGGYKRIHLTEARESVENTERKSKNEFVRFVLPIDHFVACSDHS